MGGISEACFFQDPPVCLITCFLSEGNTGMPLICFSMCYPADFPPRSSLLIEISHRSPDEGLDSAYRERFYENGSICLVAYTKRHSPLRVVQFFKFELASVMQAQQSKPADSFLFRHSGNLWGHID